MLKRCLLAAGAAAMLSWTAASDAQEVTVEGNSYVTEYQVFYDYPAPAHFHCCIYDPGFFVVPEPIFFPPPPPPPPWYGGTVSVRVTYSNPQMPYAEEKTPGGSGVLQKAEAAEQGTTIPGAEDSKGPASKAPSQQPAPANPDSKSNADPKRPPAKTYNYDGDPQQSAPTPKESAARPQAPPVPYQGYLTDYPLPAQPRFTYSAYGETP